MCESIKISDLGASFDQTMQNLVSLSNLTQHNLNPIRLHLYMSTLCQLSRNTTETIELQPIKNENTRFWLVAAH